MARSSSAYLCKYSFNFFITFSLLFSINFDGAISETFTVGDDEGWDSGVNYADWSQKYNFTAGDILVFKYLKTQHNVYEVTETTFRSCDPSSGVLKKYGTGDDQIVLGEARKYWFICNFGGHCLGGMRFGVNAVGKNTTSPAGDAPPQSPMESPPPSPAGSNGGNRARGSSGSSKWSIAVLGMGTVLSFFL